jgi:hypothetical protein
MTQKRDDVHVALDFFTSLHEPERVRRES